MGCEGEQGRAWERSAWLLQPGRQHKDGGGQPGRGARRHWCDLTDPEEEEEQEPTWTGWRGSVQTRSACSRTGTGHTCPRGAGGSWPESSRVQCGKWAGEETSAAAGLRLAPHTLAPSGGSGFFLHWGLLPASDSSCVSWFCGPCCADSWILLIHRLSRDFSTPESCKFSLRLEAGPSALAHQLLLEEVALAGDIHGSHKELSVGWVCTLDGL